MSSDHYCHILNLLKYSFSACRSSMLLKHLFITSAPSSIAYQLFNSISVTRKNRQRSIKVAQKWFHQKNDRFWLLYKNCLRMWEIWANYFLPKALKTCPKQKIWSHCLLVDYWNRKIELFRLWITIQRSKVATGTFNGSLVPLSIIRRVQPILLIDKRVF